VCVQVPCVYILHTASAVTVQNIYNSISCIQYYSKGAVSLCWDGLLVVLMDRLLRDERIVATMWTIFDGIGKYWLKILLQGVREHR
jgi:hypothetical protein